MGRKNRQNSIDAFRDALSLLTRSTTVVKYYHGGFDKELWCLHSSGSLETMLRRRGGGHGVALNALYAQSPYLNISQANIAHRLDTSFDIAGNPYSVARHFGQHQGPNAGMASQT